MFCTWLHETPLCVLTRGVYLYVPTRAPLRHVIRAHREDEFLCHSGEYTFLRPSRKVFSPVRIEACVFENSRMHRMLSNYTSFVLRNVFFFVKNFPFLKIPF
ncbi:hypothetical protein POVWA2_004180 [Plasmodium ovale wallikeri]|uniref:Uncharacterized protein n=1 Tax=Plasmodium ovale wallikeri TaxID=864142 RepID=A0A1A8YIR9_PLAOA|nr:hypothetical protein POVWA1_004040 [Plasmodium ovale wallikeri]SBT31438.1 hypothetical protein POVWA2_004180 [Plasmodium ovale wallikeri]